MPTDRGRGKKPGDDLVMFRAHRLRTFLSGHARGSVPITEVMKVLGLPYELLRKPIDALSESGEILRYKSARDGSLWLALRVRGPVVERRCGTCANASTVHAQIVHGGESHDVCSAPGGPGHVVPDGPFWPECRMWRRK